MELLTLIGNALENAIKGAAPLGHAGFIRMGTKLVGDMLVLKFTNNAAADEYMKGDGLGLSSIRLICEKYDGTMSVEKSGDTFTLSVMLRN